MSIGANGRIIVWFVIGVVLATGGLLAIQSWRAPPEYMTLRSYEVRPEIATEVDAALSSALAFPVSSGHVTLSPSGQILVTATPSVQKGVEQILREVASRKPAATPSIRFEAWLVTASAGEPIGSPNLKEVEPALRELERSRGPTRFELLEKLSTQARSGQNSDVLGEHATMAVTGSLRRDSKDQPLIVALLKLSLHPSHPGPPGPLPAINAETELRPGELLVLGQSSFSGGAVADRDLYYIVRAML
jgi:hypothetical protein